MLWVEHLCKCYCLQECLKPALGALLSVHSVHNLNERTMHGGGELMATRTSTQSKTNSAHALLNENDYDDWTVYWLSLNGVNSSNITWKTLNLLNGVRGVCAANSQWAVCYLPSDKRNIGKKRSPGLTLSTASISLLYLHNWKIRIIKSTLGISEPSALDVWLLKCHRWGDSGQWSDIK